VRILLRNTETGAFLQTLSDWTLDPMEAWDFLARGRAIRVAQFLAWKNIELYLATDDGQPLSKTPLDTKS